MKTQWESKLAPRAAIHRCFITHTGKELLIFHVTGGGVSLADLQSGRVLWTSKLKKDVLRPSLNEVDVGYLVEGMDNWTIFAKASGEPRSLPNVGSAHHCVTSSGKTFLFEIWDEDTFFSIGWALVDLESGEVTGRSGDGLFIPFLGFGSSCIGRVRDGKRTRIYTGTLPRSASSVELDNLTEVDIPLILEDPVYRLVGNGEAGFAVHSRSYPDRVFWYDWFGALLSTVEIPNELVAGFSLESISTGGSGFDGLLLNGRVKSSRETTVLVVGVTSKVGIINVLKPKKMSTTREFGICGSRLVWVEEDCHNGPIKSLDIRSGEEVVLKEAGSAGWLVCDDAGIYFGDLSKGPHHFAFATI
jgi:hypothetical protein